MAIYFLRKGGGVKQFETLAEMNASTGKNDELAIVYGDDVVGIKADTNYEEIIIPDIIDFDVALPPYEEISGGICRLSLGRENQVLIFLNQISIAKYSYNHTSNKFELIETHQDVREIDGIKYFRVYDAAPWASTTVLNIPSADWDNKFASCIKTKDKVYRGLYQYNNSQWNKIQES